MAMKQRYSFDADDMIRQVREAAVKGLEIALASTSDPEVQAQFRAQYSLLPAQENFIRVYIGMREAGRSEKATAQLGGYLAGSILTDLLDEYLSTLPEIDAMASRLPAARPLRQTKSR